MNDEGGYVERLDRQRRACGVMGSALYAGMLQLAIDDYHERGALFSFIANDTRRAETSAPALRLLGALHFLALEGSAPEYAAHLPSCGGDGDPRAAWQSAADLLRHHEREISVHYADTPQTNEVARSMPLLAGAWAIAERTNMPLRLLDVGCSAGLNARFDCYRYEGEDWSWGDPDSPLVLRNRTVSGRPRLPDARLPVAARLGCDQHPLDIGSARDRMRLLSFVWPDQLERVDRLQAAFAAACHFPMRIDRADLFGWIAEQADPESGSTTVIMHSVVANHFTPQGQAQLEAQVRGMGELARSDSPLAWLRMEMNERRTCFETRYTLWPAGDDVLVAQTDGHGQEIEWHG